jgi:hypothetical protein
MRYETVTMAGVGLLSTFSGVRDYIETGSISAMAILYVLVSLSYFISLFFDRAK